MSQNHEGLVPPSSLATEESLLGAILLRPSIMGDIAGIVDASDFYNPRHQIVFNAMHSMHFTGQPIDAVNVRDELRRDGLLEEVGGDETLLGLQEATPSISNWKRYADTIVEDSRRRAVIDRLSGLAHEAYEYGKSIDQIIAEAAAISGNERIAARGGEISSLYTAQQMHDIAIADNGEAMKPWLIPGTLKAGWRLIIVAGEGVGKAVLMRFLGIHAACGRDPWSPREFIEPRRVLYVDTENEKETIDHQIRIANREINPFAEAEDRFRIWHQEGGLNLRNRRDVAVFERVLQETRPEIVMAGPLYKLYRRERNEDMEQAALEFTEILDDLRVRYGFALVLEHHAPKATGGAFRELNPFGSSLFMRWPVMGITLDFADAVAPDSTNYQLNIGRFRRDRVMADWPNAIQRDSHSKYAFTGMWNLGRGEKLRIAEAQGL